MSWSAGSYDDTVRWAARGAVNDDRILFARPLVAAYDEDAGCYYLTPLGVRPAAILRADDETGELYLSTDTNAEVDARFVAKESGEQLVREE